MQLSIVFTLVLFYFFSVQSSSSFTWNILVSSKKTAQQIVDTLTDVPGISTHRITSRLYARAEEESQKGELDLAIALLQQCCLRVPDHLLFRQTLWKITRVKFDNRNPGFTERLCGLWGKCRIQLAKLKQNDHQLLIASEYTLGYCVNDISVILDQASACGRLGFDSIRAWRIQCALKLNANHRDGLRDYAVWNEEHGRFDEAVKTWTQILLQDPSDREAKQRRLALETNMMIEDFENDPNQVTDPHKKVDRSLSKAVATPLNHHDGDSSFHLEKQQIAGLLKQVEQEPEKLQNYLHLAQEYRKQYQFLEAQNTILQALQLSGGDLKIREKWEDLEAESLVHRLATARNLGNREPSDPLTSKRIIALETEPNDFELDLYRRRTDRYPDQMDLKYEFGLRLLRAGLLNEAKLQFQSACDNADMRIRTLVALGDCYLKEESVHEAKLCYEQATQYPASRKDRPFADSAKHMIEKLSLHEKDDSATHEI